MSGPVHFDAAEADAMIEKSIAQATAEIRRLGGREAVEVELEVSSLQIVRGMMGFVLAAKAMGAPHERVAEAAGFAIANAIDQLAANYSCECVRGRCVAALAQAVPVMAQSKPSIHGQIRGTRGGRA